MPLSLARTPPDARFGVYEMGMNHAGELSALTRLVRPHVAVITTIASAHIEFFESEEGIADAKAEIFEGLEPGGTAILPFDSRHYARLRAVAERHAGRIGQLRPDRRRGRPRRLCRAVAEGRHDGLPPISATRG